MVWVLDFMPWLRSQLTSVQISFLTSGTFVSPIFWSDEFIFVEPFLALRLTFYNLHFKTLQKFGAGTPTLKITSSTAQLSSNWSISRICPTALIWRRPFYFMNIKAFGNLFFKLFIRLPFVLRRKSFRLEAGACCEGWFLSLGYWVGQSDEKNTPLRGRDRPRSDPQWSPGFPN